MRVGKELRVQPELSVGGPVDDGVEARVDVREQNCVEMRRQRQNVLSVDYLPIRSWCCVY